MHTDTDLGNSQGGAHGRHWVLDPIDGTRGFVGMRQYAVCLGMLQDGQVELGVLGCPNLPQVRIYVCVCVCVRGGGVNGEGFYFT
jgi:3'-phosphoadenosine 5'-phosphosulfate (PAPS) 3'-phosphatase